ncbi:DUF3108 domain-containing protein [Candidatus Marinimicrobia bacterium PRS2]|nr:DUF3108 domain-containing protein [Candidatus Marinimicrobia bacterium PRS2]
MPLLKRYLPMIKQKVYLLILLTTSIWGNPPNFVGEELKYSAGFRLFPAGNAILSLTSDSLNGKPAFLLATSVKTNSFLDAFYTVRDETLSWLNIMDFSLLKAVKTIHEGKYHRNHLIHTIGDSLLIWNKKYFTITEPVYDPIAFIYFLRSQELSLEDSFHFLSVGEKKVREVWVKITGIEKIKVPAGNFDCLKVESFSPDGKPLLKNNGELRVWLSNDDNKLPVKIEMKTNIGTMVMKLKEFNQRY